MDDIDMSSLIQTGTVMAADPGTRRARVKFQGAESPSGWLYVLQHPGAKVEVEAAGGHAHEAVLGEWMPKVNEQVLAVYLPVDSGDGFILGVV